MELTDSHVRYADIAIGDDLTELRKGPMTNGHLMRWSAATENWHRIHYDQKFSVEHDKLPGLLINGSWKQHVLTQMLKDWAGPTGWVLQLTFQYRGMDVADKTLVAGGRVTGKRLVGDVAVIDCEIHMGDAEGGDPTTIGSGTVLLPQGDDSDEGNRWTVERLTQVKDALDHST